MQRRASLYGIWFLAAAGNVQAATWRRLANGLTFSVSSLRGGVKSPPPGILQEKQYPYH